MNAFVITNGNIYIEKGVFAQAVYAEDGLIKAVGTNEEILAVAPAGATRFDAAGRTVIPGFNDSHMHLYKFGELLQNIDLHDATSKADVMRMAKEFLARTNPKPGTIINGWGWNQDYFTDDGTMLNRYDLDEITTDYPLIFTRACGHIVAINTPALAITGVTENTPPVDGMEFDLGEDGTPNGIFREADERLLGGLRGQTLTVDDMVPVLRAAMNVAAQNGITSIHTNDIREDNWQVMQPLYEKVQAENPTVRVYHQCKFMDPTTYQAFLDAGNVTGKGDAFNKIGPLKLFVDGSLGGRTATLRGKYYDDPDAVGVQTLTQAQSDALVQMADAYNSQVVAHAIGDAAIQQMLDSYDTVIGDENTNRHGVVHVQITDMPLLERFAEKDILALVQPIFIHYDMTVLEDRVGKELASTSYAFETLRKMGVHVSFGTDCPVEFLGTINNLHCAVTRKDLKGEPEGGFYAEQCMDVADAVDCYTLGSSYTSFEEDVKGRIKPGYYADFTVLSQNIFTINPDDIINTEIDATIVDGRVVYTK